MNANGKPAEASYFGLDVEVMWLLTYSALIRFQGREFIVDKADVILRQSLSKAA
jgi:hypothetical protein